MSLRTIAGASLAALLLTISTTSYAADIAVRAPTRAPTAATYAPSWFGFYIGGFAGYGWGDADATAPFDQTTGFFYNFTGNPYSFRPEGFFGGGTVGFNVQTGMIVWGIEGEGGYLGLRGSVIEPNGLPTFPDTVTRFKSGAYGAITGRLGVAVGDILVYGKGGFALLDAEASTIDSCTTPGGGPPCGTGTLRMTSSRLMTGWTAGGGVEVMVDRRWSVKAEYAYFDFDRIRPSGPSNVPGELYRQTIDVVAHTAKIGLNFRWAASEPVRARY